MDKLVLLKPLVEDLKHYEALAEKAIAEDDFDAHFVYGGQYHRTANRIASLTGFDPRPTY